MKSRTRKMMDNKIWEYLEVLGESASLETKNRIVSDNDYYRLRKIIEIAERICLEVNA